MSIIKKLKSLLGGKQLASVESLRKTGLSIGNYCEIYSGASFGSEPYLISLGDHVRVNDGVHFVTHDGRAWILRVMETMPDYQDVDIFGRIAVGNNVHIGTNSIIMPGVTIGNNVIIGCGAIVCHDVPDSSVAVGIPARVIETIDDYIEKIKVKWFKQKKCLMRKKSNFC